MSPFTKAERRELRRLSSLAYERELAKELSHLSERFSEWQAGELTPFELSDEIHDFHDGINRDLYKFYTMLPREHTVARALVEDLLSRSEVSKEVLDKIESTIAHYQDLKESDDNTGSAAGGTD